VKLAFNLSTTIPLVCILTALSGCATMATKGDLPDIELPTKPGAKPSLVFRYFSANRSTTGDLINPKFDPDIEAQYLGYLSESGFFSTVRALPKKFRHEDVQFTGSFEEYKQEVARALEVSFPVDADLFMDIEDVTLFNHHHPFGLFGILHLGTLGLFPIWWENDVRIKIALRDPKGRLIHEEEIGNDSTIWAWTPLLAFNGFKFFTVDRHEPIRRKAFRSLLLHVQSVSPESK
jgi:hypothetical protein